jgi:hypothetical protein
MWQFRESLAQRFFRVIGRHHDDKLMTVHHDSAIADKVILARTGQ